jgi:hypothetical protein
MLKCVNFTVNQLVVDFFDESGSGMFQQAFRSGRAVERVSQAGSKKKCLSQVRAVS